MQVKIEVAFPSGARVELSKAEVEKVQRFIHQMLFEVEKKEPVVRKKRRGWIKWTEAEINEALRIMELENGKEKARQIKAFCRVNKRNTDAFYAKVYNLKNKKKTDIFQWESPTDAN
jgi:hypothetical protein